MGLEQHFGEMLKLPSVWLRRWIWICGTFFVWMQVI